MGIFGVNPGQFFASHLSLLALAWSALHFDKYMRNFFGVTLA